MPKTTDTGQPAERAKPSRRGTLNRERVLEAALAVTDAEGVDALTMRRVATELGVDPMALYRHVASKDALLDGLVEMLWQQVPPPPRRSDQWVESLRGHAHALRSVVNAHPNAAGLLLTRCVLSQPALERYDTLLANLRDAGFDEVLAARILRTVTSTALGDALAALTYYAFAGPALQEATDGDTDAWISLSQALPADTPPALVRTAYTVCACEPDADFTFVLDLILHGAEQLKRSRPNH